MQSIVLWVLLLVVPPQDKFKGSLEQNNVLLSGDVDEKGYFLRVGDSDPKAQLALVKVTYRDGKSKKDKTRTQDFVITLVPDAFVLTDSMPTKPEDVQSIVVEVRRGTKKIATAKWKR
jgi:hypothetical protein